MTLTPFHYSDHEVRVLDLDGEPWFVLADLTKVLGVSQFRTDRLDDALIRNHPIQDRLGRTQTAVIVSEAGMYEVVIRSDKPEAVAFRRWITADVLPAIRKTGSYGVTPALTEDQIIAQALQLTTARVEKLTARLAIVEPKAEAFDRWLSSNINYGAAQVAQALMVAGAPMGRNRLFGYLDSIGWIYRTQRGDWAPYQAQIETGRLVVKLSRAENSRTGEEFATTTVRITPKGVAKLAALLEVAPATVADALASEGVAA